MGYEEGSRFSEYTPDNHQAPLYIVTSLTLTYAVLFLITRVAVKFKVLGFDDLFLGVAHVLGIAQWGVIFAALHDGVGKRVGPTDGTGPKGDPAKLVYVSRILFLFTLGMTKISIILFLRDVFAPSTGTVKKRWGVCTILLMISAFWTIVSVVITRVGCSPNDALSLKDKANCAGDTTRWITVTVIDVVIEILLVAMPIYLFKSVHISKQRKLTIFGAFVPRILVPAFFIAFLESYISFRRDGGTSIAVVASLVWQQVLMCYALISATTPCLKGFLGKFRTDGVLGATDGSYSGSRHYGYGSRTNTRQDQYALESLSRKSSLRRIPDEAPITLACRPPDIVTHSATAYAEPMPDPGADESVKSYGSEKMMIHRKVEYDVHTS